MADEIPSAEAFHLAGDRLGKFVIIAELGRGSMGVVYEAFQEDLKRKVAIKVLPANISLDAKQVKRFHREAESVARLRHANIIQIFEVGAVGNTHYFAMEMVDGQPFGAHHGRDRDSVREAARVAMEAARGIAHAHGRGVIHRDIKPGNLLVDRTGRVVVTDFGLARLTESASLTSTDAIVGTPKYMSPEQILAGTQPLDGRTDVYSLGATLYEVIAGRPPLEAPSVQAYITAVLEERPPTPRRFNRAVPIDLATIVLRCLEKRPADRYADAEALALDLERFLAGERIVAKPRGAVALAYEVVRRRRLLFALGTVALVTLLATLVLTRKVSDTRRIARMGARINEIHTESREHLDDALGAAIDLTREFPDQAGPRDLVAELSLRRAQAALEAVEVEWPQVLHDLAAGGQEGGFWHLMGLIEVGKREEAWGRAARLPAASFLSHLVLARLAYEAGSYRETLEHFAEAPPADALPPELAFRELLLGLAAEGLAREQADAAAARALLAEARAHLAAAHARSDALRERWLTSRIILALANVRGQLGEFVDLRSILPDLASRRDEVLRGLSRFWSNMSPPESASVRLFVERILALAGEEGTPHALLARRALERLEAPAADAQERATANLMLAIARLGSGDAEGARGALDSADDLGFRALLPYIYWGQSLVSRVRNDLPQAVNYAVLAIQSGRAAGEEFPDMPPLVDHATMLAEEAARRGGDDAEGATGLLDRVRAAAGLPVRPP